MPAVVHWPQGLEGGRKVHEMIHFCDWMPTLFGACSLRADATDGYDMMKVLRGEGKSISNKRFWQFNRYEPVMHCNAAMRDGNWKLYWPRISEAMGKLQSDNVWYRRMMREPHFEMQLPDEHFIERALSDPGKPQLYNLQEDYYEENDMADAHPERLTSMVHALENWFEYVEYQRKKLPEYTR